MIIVTGTMRSGTSLWMRILQAAGFVPIGEAFPLDWGSRPLRGANPEGFFESILRDGIHHATNPHPETGTYLRPEQCHRLAVKVFPHGFAMTHRAFIDHVVVTTRQWRAHSASRARLAALDEATIVARGVAVRPVERVPAHFEWWMENYLLLCDLRMRRLPFRWTMLEQVRAEPEARVVPVLEWLGADPRAHAVVDVQQPSSTVDDPVGVDADMRATFDELCGRIGEGSQYEPGFLQRAARLHARLLPAITAAYERQSESRR